MAEIIGTPGNDPALNGTGDADTITALGGNDTVNAGAGNDTISGGLGNDILNGDDGDDLFIEDEFTSNLDVFNGGIGFDTIELRNVSVPIVTTLGTVAFHNFSAANALSSIERLVFASTGSQVIQGGIAYGSVGSSGLVELVAGAGVDRMVYFTGTAAGTYTMPVLTYTGWSSFSLNAWEHNGDYLVLTSAAAPGTAVTLNAAAGLGIQQVLSGGSGDDTLNGSENPDSLDGAGGVNQLFGNGGNDMLVISNLAVPTGPTTWGPPSTLGGAGGTLDGGSGTDVLAIGGSVDLQATLVSIEGVFLLPEFTPPANNTARRYAAELILDSAHIAMLPVNTFFTGTGSVVFRPADGASLNTGTYSINAGSAVSFRIEAGTGNGLTFTGNSGNDTIILGTGNQTGVGGNGNDSIVFGMGTQIATGGAGADAFSFGGPSNNTVTDFTIGTDKVDLSDSEIYNQSRLFDLLSQDGGGAVLAATTIDGTFQMTLQGVNLANLSASDFILGTEFNGNDNETGTAAAEYFFGGSGNDQYHAGDGNDRIYAGGGLNQVFGEGGDDTIVLDGVLQFGGTYDGGAGTDTLLVRSNSASLANGPATQYFIFPGAPGTGLVSVERIVFDSSASYALTFITNAAPGITEAVGGAGVDTLVFVATSAGTYSVPSFTLSNWGSNDFIVLSAQASTAFDVTFNGRNDVSQFLIGQGGNDTLNGGALADTLRGGAGNDTLTGNGGIDVLNGEAGNDRLVVSAAGNGTSVDGGGDIDTLAVTGAVTLGTLAGLEGIELVGGASLTLSAAQLNAGFYNAANQLATALISGSGSLVINMSPSDVTLSLTRLTFAGGSNVAVTVNGSSGFDAIKGVLGAVNVINGGDGGDQIRGGNMGDTIDGGIGNDKIYGAGGVDVLTGGAGADQFRYVFASDSGLGAAADLITDFEIGGDRLNFLLMDADPLTAGDQAFAFLGTGSFANTGLGQIRYQNSGADLLVQIDSDGNGIADMEVMLLGLAGQALTGADFLL